RQLGVRDGLGGVAEPASRPRLDLDEHELVAVERDDVELTGVPAPVAVQDRPPELLEPLCGPLLSSPSDGVLGTHGTTSAPERAAGTWRDARAERRAVDPRGAVAACGRPSRPRFRSSARDARAPRR